MKTEVVKSVLFGLAVGDALGVPVEFRQRQYLKMNPVKGITGYGSWNQPPGTWSDDSSLAFCLAQSLADGEYNLGDISEKFIQWMGKGYWGAHHKVFDVGGATRFAIGRLKNGTSPLLSGGMMDDDNGNGSLMRIAPLLFHVKDFEIAERYKCIKEVSSITHAHFRSVFSCFIYVELALQILNGKNAADAYLQMQSTVNNFANENDFNKEELRLFSRILKKKLVSEKEKNIQSGGYVLHTLEASVWCLLTTNNYRDAVLKAVNLGGDTDTTACVTGGLAGLLYGFEGIPADWINAIARKNDIDDLCVLLNSAITNKKMKPITKTLYRPVNNAELQLIKESNWKQFPPRLPEQPIFYPVDNESYAVQITRKWNVPAYGESYVVSFDLALQFLSKYPMQNVGGVQHNEYWIPSEELEEMNNNIIGPIKLIGTYKQ